jgi:CheY-like chemotaxis protein
MLHLESFGLTVDAVVNGEEAVGAVAKTHYDLVFIDLQMPHMDGLQVGCSILAVPRSFWSPEVMSLQA